MLANLTIQNFGLIDRLAVDFTPKLNILTGETGAGKSILIDALRFALGERLESTHVRDKNQPCHVEAVFDIRSRDLREHPVLADLMPADETALIIQRTYFPDGRTKVKVNGSSLTVAQLKTLGDRLVDFHGAHDHQLLLADCHHREILDQLVDFNGLIQEYQEIFKAYSAIKKQLDDLTSLAQNRQRDMDLLTHQIRELEQVPLDENKYEETAQEQIKINNAEKLHEHIQHALDGLEGEDSGVDDRLRKTFSSLKSLSQIDDKTLPLLENLTLAQEHLQQLLGALHDYADSLDFDQDSALEISRRFDLYTDIKRKYGPTLADAQALYRDIKQKFELIANLEHNDAQLRRDIGDKEKELAKIAQKITKKRLAAAAELKTTIENELKELGISHVQFEARLEKGLFTEHGQDTVVFYISPNAGEDLKPLAQIVSSGEAARVMLALKKALINVDPVPVLIFDEIDAQIGGRLGTVTGRKLKELSHNRQVILITHLPQIASFADTHFKITKTVKAGRASTDVLELDPAGRVKELAQMMSGHKESDISVTHAEEMLAKAKRS